jgi:uncharacterized protein
MQKDICFYSGPGLKLAGRYKAPDRSVTPESGAPGIVLCPGPSAGRDALLEKVSDYIVGRGFATLTFMHRGVGDSEGPRHRLIPLEQVEDIRCALTFMEQQPEVDAGRLGLWGAATGGGNVTYVSGIDPRVKCMVSVSGAGDCGRWLKAIRRYGEWVDLQAAIVADRRQRVLTGESALYALKDVIQHDPITKRHAAEREAKGLLPSRRELSLESVEHLIAHRPESVVAYISPRAAMWICIQADALVPSGESKHLYALAGEPKELVVLNGLEHHDLYDGAGFELMMSHSCRWLDRHLVGD